MPSRKLAPFNLIILDHVNVNGFINHNCELQGHLDLNNPKPHLVALNKPHLTCNVKPFPLVDIIWVSRLDRRDGRQGGGIALFAFSKIADCIILGADE